MCTPKLGGSVSGGNCAQCQQRVQDAVMDAIPVGRFTSSLPGQLRRELGVCRPTECGVLGRRVWGYVAFAIEMCVYPPPNPTV